MNAVTCAKCGATLLGENFNTGALAPCPACRTPTRIDIFPALFRRIEAGGSGQSAAEGIEASCFFHPQKKALVACESCGRFLCELCDLDLNGKHLCSSCLASGKKKGKLRDLERERVLYDNLALGLATLPILMWPFTLLTAPAAIFVGVRYWRAPGSIVGRQRWRSVLAILLAAAQVCGWIALFLFLIFRRH